MKIHLKRIFIILLAVTFVFQTAAFSASSGIRVFADTEEQITGLLETEENESSTLSEKDHPDGDVLREENGEAIEMNTPETDTEEVSAEDARTEEETAEEVYEETSEAAEEPGIFNGEVEKAAAEQPLRAAAGTSILAFTSDTHNKSGNVAANRLGSWLDKMQGIYGRKVDLMAFGGDMANASASQTDFWTLTQADMDQLTQRNITGVYTTGNHEYSPGNYSNGLNSTTQVYIENAEGFEGSNYRIYCLGSSAYAESSGGGSWWGGGWNEYTASQVSKLSEYLGGVDNSKVIIVITHYPLHYNPRRTITGASDVIDALNEAAGTGKKIVYLWGHNHTDADQANGELNYDKVFKPGDSISYSSGNSKEINFYYGAAGCMSDSEYGTGSGAVKGKGLILEINEENKLTFTYYNEGATDVTEGGSFTEKDPVPIQEATIDEATEMGPDGQFTVVQPTIEVRNTLQLHYTTVPEDATVRSITWTSDDTSIATVDSTGKVKGVNPGTTTITATISDGITRGTVSASIDVEIVPRTSSDPMYVRTDTILPDKNYIIANKDTGEAYALLNNNGTVSSVTVEIDGDTIYTDNENIVFTTEGSGTTVTAVKNNGRYISAGNSSLTLVTSAPANRTFEYSADNRFTCRSGNSTYYIYYTTYNNRYTASTSASGTSSRAVYLFEEITEQVAVTGVSVNPKTATVEARKTVDLNAIVSPSNASNKTVTWRSSDTSVATVDANGRVRGVSEGTAVITASAGGFSDTCTVTVTQSTTTEQHYVIVCDGFALSTDRSPNKAQGGSSSYTYTGLSGVEYAAGDAAADNIRWIFEEADGGYYIRSLDGDYLNATYTSGNNMGQGDLKVDGTPDVWVLDSGYSLDSGTVESSHLKSTNASSSATSDKFLGYEESPANLFTVRSSGNDDEVTISEAEDPVAVTGVSVTPKTAEIEARNTVQLTATVTPSNATNKTVTWSSSNTSVAVVDGNGRVRGVSEGEAVITASVGGFSDSCTVTVTASTSSEPTYVITVGNVALSTVPSDEQMENAGSGSQRYYYTGLAGAPFDPDEAADDTIRWILEPAEGGYYIKSLSGDYLNATYTQNSTGGYSGVLKLDSTPDVWVLDGTLDSWEVDGSLLKSSNASANASSPKYLAYDTGTTSSPRNLFTVRSESSASETTLVEAEDPVAVTGVSVTPETATVKARETVQLKATVTPSDATVKTVTWTSSNTAIATVDENGKVKGVAEGEAVITASAGGFSDTCTVTVTAGDPITGYVIMIDGFALSTDRSPNQAQGGNSSYTYTGLAGVAYSAEEDPAENIRWILEETDGGYYIRSLDGRYLNGAYTSGSNSGQGNLKLDDTRDVWVLDGTLEDWMIDGSMIRSTNATASTPDRPKYLGYEEAPANLFTVRSEENADESTLVDPSVTIEERFVETDRFEDGKEYIIGVTKDSGSVYAIKNVTGTNTGNTGSITLDVTPASGSEAAYIVTDDKDVVWKYSGGNQYLIASTGSDHYLGYESSSYVPRTSSQGRAIIYSGGKLQISSGHYLTCTGGTFATTTNSGSGSDVRLFVKTIEIITHEHTYGDPVWSWSGNVTAKATRATVSATATFTCTECGESITEEAAITTSEVSGRTLYTATVTGPDGKEYTDKKFAGDEAKYTITITADKETAAPGEEINFTITLGPVDRFGTFQMELAVPEGLTYKENSFEIEGGREGLINTLGFDDVDWTDSVRRFIGYTVGTDYISTEDTVLATFKCTVNSGFEGSATVGLTRLEFYSSEDWELNLTDLYEIITATINTHVHVAGETVVENEVQATCTTDGGYDNVVYCTICEEEMSRTHVTVPATGHDWEFVDFTWTGSDEAGYTAAVANYVCKNNDTHKQTVAATVTSQTTAATCETAGQTVYTATVDAEASLDEAAHSNDKTVAIPMLGHDWEFVDFTWTGSDETGYTAAVANYVCKNNADHKQTVAATVTSQTTAATCETAGQTVYTATVDAEASLDGKAHSDTKTVEIPALGHDWKFVDFTWTEAENGFTATANYECKNDATHKQTVNATVTAVTTPAACETAGQTVYTATVDAEASLDKEAHSTTKTVAIPALAHDWKFVDFTWTEAENGFTAVANYECKNDATHKQTVAATVTSQTTAATCEGAGSTIYTATVAADASLDKEAHNTTKTVAIPALTHDWEFVDFTWTEAENGFTATANYECKNDATHKQTVAATVTSQTTAATCEAAGQTVYTATVAAGASLDGEAHNATKTVAIPALTHDWEFIDFTWTEAENGYTAVANYKCKNDESHTRIVAATVTSQTTAATCEGTGSTVYTVTVAADASLDKEAHSTTKTVVIPALGHDYTGPVWVWAADKGSAEARFTCSRCGNVQTVQDTEIEKTQGTGEHTGYTAYTASVAFEDETYTNTVYVVNQYTLTFYANEGDTEPFAVITQDYGSAVTAPGTPAKAFYTFSSWDAEVPETMPAENRTFNATWTAKDTYYLVGSMNEWTVSEDYEFVVNPQNSGEYSAGAALTAGDEIKVVRAIAGVAQNGDYYPSNEHIGYNGWTDNYTVDQYHAGNVTVYFRPAGNFTDLLWQNFGGYFYIEGDHLVTVDVSPSDKGTAYVTRDGSAAATATAPNGMPLTVHYTPADNYQLDRIEILKDDGTAADVTLDGDSFNMPNHNIRVKVYFKVITWTFDEIKWTGSDEAGYTAAAKYTGDNGAVKTVDAAVTSQTTAATCEADGSTVYTAAVTAEASLDGEAKNGTKTVVIPKLGHDWEFVDFTWTAAEGGYTAVANYKCKNDAAHTNTATATVTAQITPATCEAAGSTVYTAAVTAEASPDGRAHSDTKTVAIPALNHDWEFVDFTWTEAENGYTAVANYECKNNAEHKQSVAATVTHVTTPATCEAAGQTVYTATVAAAASPDGEAKSDTKTVVIPKLGHNWEFVNFTWTEAENGYTAVANYKCKNDASHTNTAAATVTVATTPAACETAGSNVYTATVTAEASLDGKAHSDSKTVAIPALNHDWKFVDFTWTEAENGYTAVANYVCNNDAAHTNTVAATVTVQTTPATCEAAGQTVYTATVAAAASLDGKAQSDTNTVVIPATGHNWEFVDFTWTEAENGYTAVANYKCKNDASHTNTAAATVTVATTPAACETAGSTVYTATVAAAASLDGKAQSDTKTVAIPATGHNWEFVDFTWTGSDEEGYTAAIANYKCKTDASHTQTLKSTLTSDVTPATCEEAGQTVYTASVTAADSLDKAAHDNSKTVEVKALGHDWNEPTYVWNTDHTAVIAIFACKRNPAHMETVTATGDKITSETTKEPAVGAPGEKTYTAAITGPDGKIYTATATEEIPALENKEVIRIFGSDRYETSFKVADELKEQLGKDKFDQAILAYGQNFPDALAGSYLSCILQAPILLVDSRANRIKDAQDYIKENVKAGGTIYILGETGVVPAAAVAGLDGYKVKRLGGATRYETDIEILKEAAKYNAETEILVCSGNNFPDSLSAGAAGKPILLVGAKLLDSHKDYLAGLKGKVTFTIIGGSGVISDAVMKELSAYGSTDRVWGQDRYLTSVAVANRFFKDPESGVIAYGQNFPDGLCGGVLAYTIGGPLVLTVDNKSATAINYAEDAGMLSGAVLGGPTLVGDNTVRNIFQMEKEDKIIVK